MTTTGILLDTKRFAIHDGPGIRTTLFLKGCPLKCIWCHNPESISSKPQLAYYSHKCIHCEECVSLCLHSAHEMKKGKHIFDPDKCTACGNCESECLGEALKFYGKKMTIDEALDIVLEDRTFYENSGGGVTLSGGEPLLQSQFCSELLKALKKEGIHTAIDTCGFVNWQAFEAVLPATDMFLFDFKHSDSKIHKQLTGQTNELILENLKKLSELNARIEIRIPMIKGCNDSTENIQNTAAILADLKIEKLKLLPYHALAHTKYTSLSMTNTMPNSGTPSESELKDAKMIFKSYGVA